MSVQFAELSAAPDIIVATPGRLLHHLTEVPGFNLKSVNYIVLDEADRLFEMGLGSQVPFHMSTTKIVGIHSA